MVLEFQNSAVVVVVGSRTKPDKMMLELSRQEVQPSVGKAERCTA